MGKFVIYFCNLMCVFLCGYYSSKVDPYDRYKWSYGAPISRGEITPVKPKYNDRLGA